MSRQANSAPETARVWYAAGSTNPSAAKGIAVVGSHQEDRAQLTQDELIQSIDLSKKRTRAYRSGVELAPNEIGSQFSLRTGSKEPLKADPFMNFGGSWMVVTSETRALLEDLDPGPLRFNPIEVLNANRTAPLWASADLHVMQVLTCRRVVLIEESYGIGKKRLDITPDGADVFMIQSIDRDDALVVAQPEQGGAEMWLDDRLMGALFLSDRVSKALKAAKLTRGWSLKRCVVKRIH